MKKFYAFKALLKKAGGGMHPPPGSAPGTNNAFVDNLYKTMSGAVG